MNELSCTENAAAWVNLPSNATPKYSAFSCSLDKFAPVIDLKVADVREPKTPGLQRFALAIRILGFVLVPLALASIGRMFK